MKRAWPYIFIFAITYWPFDAIFGPDRAPVVYFWTAIGLVVGVPILMLLAGRSSKQSPDGKDPKVQSRSNEADAKARLSQGLKLKLDELDAQ